MSDKYKIKNWEKFQHFKNRTPPWIKLYRDLLNDPEWHNLNPAYCKRLVMLWLIASEDKEHKGYLPSIDKTAFRLRVSVQECKKTLDALSGWVLPPDINAISSCHQSATSETETETETEKKKEEEVRTPPPPPQGILELVNQIRNCNQNFKGLNQMMLENELKAVPIADARFAVKDFCRDMAGALKLPDMPIKKLAAYLRKAYDAAQPRKPRSTIT